MSDRDPPTIFFVLNGLLDGERGIGAYWCGPPNRRMRDGWYWLRDDGDADGVGPFLSRDDAVEAERAAPSRN